MKLQVSATAIIAVIAGTLVVQAAYGANVPVPAPRPAAVSAAASEEAAPAKAATAKATTAKVPAKQLFGKKAMPADLKARAIGTYAKGCLAGGAALPLDGPNHQVMRLSRNRNWGHPALVQFVEDLAAKASKAAGWPGLLVGDMAQPRGGPMLTGHASHQIGLDADIWLNPAPTRTLSRNEREKISATSVLDAKLKAINDKVWTPAHLAVIKQAANDKRVARIFVNPVIKKKLCESAGNDRGWLRIVRPWYGHHYHFHVRLKCPSGSDGCRDQAAPPAGDGCGAELSAWFKPPPKPKPGPTVKPKPKPELTLADLPQGCVSVLEAP